MPADRATRAAFGAAALVGGEVAFGLRLGSGCSAERQADGSPELAPLGAMVPVEPATVAADGSPNRLRLLLRQPHAPARLRDDSAQ